MEMEYRDPSKRGKAIVVIGVVLALAAGGAAFYLINQAQQKAGQGTLQKTDVVVAVQPIPARKPIEADDIEVRQVPLDPIELGRDRLQDARRGHRPGPARSRSCRARSSPRTCSPARRAGAQFSILQPGETIAPDSEAWRAVSLTVPDERAVGGLLQPGMTVDVLTSATVNVPQDLLDAGRYYTDKSTKITYQNMVILAKTGQFYVVKATLQVAEEISHLMAAGNATFSLIMRPEADIRTVDVSKLGETTNKLISKYGLPVPEVFPPGNGPIPTPAPTPSPSPGSSPAPSASPAP